MGYNYCVPFGSTKSHHFDLLYHSDPYVYFLSDTTDPKLLLDCDGNNVLSINISPNMINASETVMVNDGAICTLTIRNEPWPMWFVKYTIYHDDKRGIQIQKDFSREKETYQFKRIPECDVDVLLDNAQKESLYSHLCSETIEWIMNDDPFCEDTYFIERYSLGMLLSVLCLLRFRTLFWTHAFCLPSFFTLSFLLTF